MWRKAFTNEKIDDLLQYKSIKRVGNFVNFTTLFDVQCLICGFLWLAKYDNLRKQKHGCPKCTDQRLGKEEVNNRLKNCDIQLISNYCNRKTISDFQCLKCSNIWKTTPELMFLSKECAFCGRSAGKPLNNDIIDFLLAHKNIKRLSSFISNKDDMDFICLIDGCQYKWTGTTASTISSKRGCPACAGTLRLNNDIVDDRLKNRNILRLGDYIDMIVPIDFLCLNNGCGHVWKAPPNRLISEREVGCPICNVPRVNEKSIFTILKENGVLFKFDHHIKKIDITENKKYRIDFYFPQINKAIEYNGVQHYQPILNFFGKQSTEAAQDRLTKQQMRDEYVNTFCINHNIQLIWIDGRNYYAGKLKQYVMNDIIPWLNRK